MGTRLDSVDLVKKSLRIPATETLYDVDLGAMVEDISAECSKYTSRVFPMSTYNGEIYRSPWTDTVVLRNYPVNASMPFAMSIYNGVEVLPIDASDYVVDNPNGIVRLRPGVVFTEEPDTAIFTYTAGFADNNLGGTAEAILIPGDLAYSIRRYVSARWKNQNGVLSEDDYQKVIKNVQSTWASYARQI